MTLFVFIWYDYDIKSKGILRAKSLQEDDNVSVTEGGFSEYQAA